MSLRKNKTVRDKVQERLEGRLDDLIAQADGVRQQLADRAPEVRDTVVAKAQSGVADLRERLPEIGHDLLDRAPELSEKTYDRLPKGVADRLPDEVKPKKKRRLRRVVGIGLLIGAGAAAFATLKGKQTPPPPPYQPATPPPAPPKPAAPADSLDSVDAPGTN